VPATDGPELLHQRSGIRRARSDSSAFGGVRVAQHLIDVPALR
jgi:hypothetical protein